MKKKILIVILLLIAIGGAIGIYQWNKPKRTADDEKPAATLTAEDLFNQFATNEAAANTSYLNKIIQVNGKVLTFEKSSTEFVIYLETSDVLGTVSCTLIPGTEITATEGSDVTIKGICTGYLTDVVLTQCVLVQ